MRRDYSTRFALTRRGFFVGGVAALACQHLKASAPSCQLTAEQEEGPYYIDDEKLRRNITEGRPGVPLILRVALVDATRCTPLENAALDIWHCDALGMYSGFTGDSPDGRGGPGRGRGPGGGPGFGGPGPGGGPGGGPGRRGMRPPDGGRQTDATRFLRGVQLTDKKGVVEFATLFPGWYSGRAIHIHLKVHIGGAAAAEKYAGGHVAHTGQLFIPEEITEEVAKLEPYATRLNVHRTLQTEDGIFNSQHGSTSMVNIDRLRSASNADGFLANVTLAVDTEATPGQVGGFGRGRGGPQ
jgi:protocatechuate 3,4-dioxygenase beta subunit